MATNFRFRPNQPVHVKYMGIDGTGKVVGCTSIETIFGRSYIVKLDDPQKAGVDPQTYPYDTISIQEECIEEIAEVPTKSHRQLYTNEWRMTDEGTNWP